MRTTVAHLLAAKGREIWSVTPDESVYSALEAMAEKSIGALVVVDDQGRLVGIVSERDYARKVVLLQRISTKTAIREIMTSDVHTVSPENDVTECMQMMTDKRIRHLPVMSGDAVVGVVSIGDIVKAVIHDQQFLIEQLEQYITS